VLKRTDCQQLFRFLSRRSAPPLQRYLPIGLPPCAECGSERRRAKTERDRLRQEVDAERVRAAGAAPTGQTGRALTGSTAAGAGRVALQASLQRLYDDLPVDVASLQDGFLVARGTTTASGFHSGTRGRTDPRYLRLSRCRLPDYLHGWRTRLQALVALTRKAATTLDAYERTALGVKHPIANEGLLCAAHQRCMADVATDRLEAWNAEVVTPAEWAALRMLYVVPPKQAPMVPGAKASFAPACLLPGRQVRRRAARPHLARPAGRAAAERAAAVPRMPRSAVWAPRATRCCTPAPAHRHASVHPA